jgi:GNAT superfamily N-acetyltransferase
VRWRSLADDDHLGAVAAGIEAGGPPFLAELTAAHRQHLADSSPDTTFVVTDDRGPGGCVRARGGRWDGTSDGAPAGGAGDLVGHLDVEAADTLLVADVTVASDRRGAGLGAAVLRGLHELRASLGLSRSLLLARPHAKQQLPLVPFARYVSFVDDGGTPVDGWLRAVWLAGFTPARGVDRSLVARAPVAAWERWLGHRVPGSGPYLVPGAIKPTTIEVERDEGRYREPHLWMGAGEGVTPPSSAWVADLAAAGVVAGDRSHRELRRPR